MNNLFICLSKGSKENRQLDLRAMAIYSQANILARKNTTKGVYGADEIHNELVPLLRSEMLRSKLNLYEQQEALLRLNYDWEPQQIISNEKLSQCAAVQHAMMGILNQNPSDVKRAVLISACEEYKAKLNQKISIHCNNIELNLIKNTNYTAIDDAEYTDSDNEENNDNLLLKNEATQEKITGNDCLYRNLAKYKIVVSMLETLKTNKPVDQQLADFKMVYNNNSSIIKQRADEPAKTFLKAVATIFSLGIGLAFGLWQSRTGCNLSKQLNEELRNTPQI